MSKTIEPTIEDAGQASLPLLDVRDLTVEFATRRGIVRAVQGVDISLAKGETLGIVGESGSGKSVTSYAVMRILDRAGRIAEGSVMFTNIDVRTASEDEMRDIRGREISMIFQNPRAALNPIRKIGHQIEDVLIEHVKSAPSEATEKAIEILDQVRIARPRERYHAYPFELSGGMCQRVVIALALACQPQLLIADEPTTGLDVTTQKTVMDLIVDLTRERGMSTILITHDLGLAATYCDRVVVMEKGEVVETATARAIFTAPSHPYTRKLMRATPRPGMALRDLLPEEEGNTVPAGANVARLNTKAGEPLLVVQKLVKEYPRKGLDGIGGAMKKIFRGGPAPEPDVFRAVDGISFTVNRGESVGLVGESGCGKSTTSTMIMRLIDKTDGVILFDGEDIGEIPGQELRQAAAAQAHPDGVPGPDRQPQPALHRGARHRRSDPAAGRSARAKRGAGALRGTGPPGRPAGRTARPLPASALGRAEGPRRHRPRHRPAARSRHPRRADRGARRVGPGGGAQPVAGAQGLARDELPLRVARSERGAAAVRPRDRHARRQDRRGRTRPTACCSPPRRSTPATCWPRSRTRISTHRAARRAGWPRCDGAPHRQSGAQAQGVGSQGDSRTRRPQAPPANRLACPASPIRSTISSPRARARSTSRSNRPGCRRSAAICEVTLRHGALVAAFALPDDAEPAPVFEA